jgi:tellurite resistance protein
LSYDDAVQFDVMEVQHIARALAVVAAADGVMLPEERGFIEGWAYAHGVGGRDWSAAPLDEVGMAAALRRPEQRREVIKLCLALALSDRDFAPEEIEAVGRIAVALSVSEEDMLFLVADARAEASRRR